MGTGAQHATRCCSHLDPSTPFASLTALGMTQRGVHLAWSDTGGRAPRLGRHRGAFASLVAAQGSAHCARDDTGGRAPRLGRHRGACASLGATQGAFASLVTAQGGVHFARDDTEGRSFARSRRPAGDIEAQVHVGAGIARPRRCHDAAVRCCSGRHRKGRSLR